MNQRIVVAAAIINNAKLLILKRSDNLKIAPGIYHLPGGHVEQFESPQDALAREIKEELDILITVVQPVHAFHYQTGNIHTIGITFYCKLISDINELKLFEQTSVDYKWIAKSEINKYLTQVNDHNRVSAINAFKIQIDNNLL